MPKRIFKIGLVLLILFRASLTYAETYKVKPGDTLGKVAQKYHVSVKQLKTWNKIKGDKVYVGQRLKIRPDKGYVTKKDYYVVKKGDSLSGIAHKTHTTTANLKKINHLKSDIIQPGRRLLVRVRKVKKHGKGYESEAYPDTPPTIEPTPIIEGNITFYTVKDGETLESIASQSGLEIEEICEANLMPEDTVVKKGQILSIPQQTEETTTSDTH
ncbi:MAG: LysM peptidoglycan-binding domain-containing protein [Candidatus Omnitrophota bacterium]